MNELTEKLQTFAAALEPDDRQELARAGFAISLAAQQSIEDEGFITDCVWAVLAGCVIFGRIAEPTGGELLAPGGVRLTTGSGRPTDVVSAATRADVARWPAKALARLAQERPAIATLFGTCGLVLADGRWGLDPRMVPPTEDPDA